MAMNIKSERVHALAREAARRTNTSQTSVIEVALRALLDDLDRDAPQGDRGRRVWEWFDSYEVTDEQRAAGRAALDDLYDERGLPA